MIVVVGSRHDPVSAELVAEWPGAALCSAHDLSSPGWAWSPTGAVESRWVVDGAVVDDAEITGVFVRRSAFYEEEFTDTHPDDRRYLAAEAHAFMADVLGSTSALVANPVADGTFGDEVVRPDRWSRAALSAGLGIAPIRLRSAGPAPRSSIINPVEVVGFGALAREVFGSAPPRTLSRLSEMASLLDLAWATFVLDSRHRVVTVTTTRPPSAPAREMLGRLLAGARVS